MENVAEFPLLKTLDADEAVAVAKRIGAKLGVVLFECPCGCGKIKCIEIGEPDARDMILYAENLRGYAMDVYVDEIEGASLDEIP